MTTHSSEHEPRAEIRRNRSFSFMVWLIPLIALLTGAWLLFDHIRNTGPEITLYMANAEGIEVNNTVIKVLDVEVGRVTAIHLRPGHEGVALTAQLTGEARDMVRKDSQFWIVKPRVDQSGITGLSTLVSGSYIALMPGKSPEEENEFTVADFPPVAAFAQGGLRLRLKGGGSKILSNGSPVMYRDINVGIVESAEFDPVSKTVSYQIFIASPNDKLVGSKARFWLQSGLKVELANGGLKVDSPSLPALISGAIAFDDPPNGDRGGQVGNNALFKLYANRAEVDNQADERSLYYVVFFKQSVRGLAVDAPVEYKGIPVGTVTDVPYFDRNDSLRLFDNGWIPVRIRIDPSRLEMNADAQSKEAWADQIGRALNRGLSATLASNNLLTGSLFVELSEAPGQSMLKPVASYQGNTVIATRNGAGLGDLQQQVSDLLDKFNRLPLDKTVRELNGSLAELKGTLAQANRLLGQPQTQQLPGELNRTLAELRNTLQGVSPQSPVYGDVQKTLRSIDRTLQQAAPVLNTLKEQPNALIFNSSATDPTPKGSR
ncbi:intermembrane transport protein PqiB [Eikenella sp. S3360]|uniref:Intermembrane transport protein PqiB n=1 Tax=Eikenella glucosivorans TaxID=2766967 RepID=A0ABS0NAH0_9NEIS|nr:intermembrane transport protein PqiB [Eikenella glucosivorans]MBH5329316.1 intermembrane transport protein PqiB [Eikenella glucosivorans]